MNERRDNHEPLIFDDEPEVTYEPPARRGDDASQRMARGAAWAAGGAALGGGVAAGGSSLANTLAGLDIFQSASAQAGSELSDLDAGDENLSAPLDFSAEPVLHSDESPLADLIYGAAAEVSGGYTMEGFETFDPDQAAGALDDLDFSADEDDVTTDFDDDLETD